MKSIINGKKYDTETATICGKFVVPALFTDYVEHIVLYRKTNGEYFFYHYTKPEYSYIEPATEVKAKKWSEQFLSADEYESIFGEVSE